MTLEEYERVVRKLAVQQRNLLDYIAMRENQSVTDKKFRINGYWCLFHCHQN